MFNVTNEERIYNLNEENIKAQQPKIEFTFIRAVFFSSSLEGSSKKKAEDVAA